MRILAVSILVMSHAGVSVAQVEPQTAIAKCASVQGDGERLTCYDALARSLGLSGPRVKPLTGKGKWSVKETRSLIDDSRSVYLSLAADTPVANRFGQTVTPTLHLRCSENSTNVFIDWGVYLGIDETTMLTRLDADEAKRSAWGISTDHEAVFARNHIAFAKELLGSEKLLTQVTPYGESPVMATFDLRGLADAIKPLQEACHWQ